MLNGRYQGRAIGSGIDVWRFSEGVRAGAMSRTDFMEAEAGISRSAGHTRPLTQTERALPGCQGGASSRWYNKISGCHIF